MITASGQLTGELQSVQEALDIEREIRSKAEGEAKKVFCHIACEGMYFIFPVNISRRQQRYKLCSVKFQSFQSNLAKRKNLVRL